MEAIYIIRYVLYGFKPLSHEDVQNMEKNVTICIKSFNRQRKTKRLYRSIRKYYPNIRILIADDSEVPLELPGAEIIYLPFNSGLPQGMIATLDKVETPYHIRLDDDMLFVIFPTQKNCYSGAAETANPDLGNPQSGDAETMVIQESTTAWANC